MSRTLTQLVAELGEATHNFSSSTSSGADAALALNHVYEAALRELHQLQHERQKWELERKQAAFRDQCIVDEQARNVHLIRLNVVCLPSSSLPLQRFPLPGFRGVPNASSRPRECEEWAACIGAMLTWANVANWRGGGTWLCRVASCT